MNFTKTFVTIFVLMSLITTTYVVAEMNKNNWNVDQYVENLELLSQVNESILTDWMIENAKYKDFHFTPIELRRAWNVEKHGWYKKVWPMHNDGINPQ